jgi:tetratricopeptide (TPR) repeat protein
MNTLPRLVAVIWLSLGSLVATFTLVTSPAFAAEEQKVGAKVGKPLQEAITDGQSKKWPDALAKLREAQAVPDKTPFEEYKINEILGWVSINQKQYPEAAAAFEKTLNGGFLSADEADKRVRDVADLYLQAKQQSKAIEYLQRWLKAHPNDMDRTALLGQSQLQSGQARQAKETFEGLVSSAEKAGQRPKEDWLQFLYRIDTQLNDNPGRLDKATLTVVEKLVRYYPSPTYWEAMLNGLSMQIRQQTNADGAKFQLYRLMLDVGALKTSDDYIEMAQLANSFGFPGEAQNILTAGFNNKVLGVGDSKERENRLLASMKKSADTDRASLPALDKKARAATTGQEDAAVGEAYLGYGEDAQAIDALERGLKKGGVNRPELAQMALGIAYVHSKQKEQAKAAFKQVPANSDLGRIASLWVLHIGG